MCMRFVQEAYDFDKFLKYLELPRHSHPFTNRFSGPEYKQITVHWASSDVAAGVLPVRYNEREVVSEYCAQWFRASGVNSIDKFQKYLDNDWLKTLLAETKVLLHGAMGDAKAGAERTKQAEEWFNRLGSSRVTTLKTRVDLDFAEGNAKQWPVSSIVSVSVSVCCLCAFCLCSLFLLVCE